MKGFWLGKGYVVRTPAAVSPKYGKNFLGVTSEFATWQSCHTWMKSLRTDWALQTDPCSNSICATHIQTQICFMQIFMVKVDLWLKCLISGKIQVYLVKMSEERVWEHSRAHFRAHYSGLGLGLCWVCVSGNEALQPENPPLSCISMNSRCIGSSPLAWVNFSSSQEEKYIGLFSIHSSLRVFWVFHLLDSHPTLSWGS